MYCGEKGNLMGKRQGLKSNVSLDPCFNTYKQGDIGQARRSLRTLLGK